MVKQEFKVGDTIERIKEHGHSQLMPIGFQGIITRLTNTSVYFDNNKTGWSIDYYRLVKPKESIINNYEIY